MNMIEFFESIRNLLREVLGKTHDTKHGVQQLIEGQKEMLKQISDLAASVASLQAQATASAAKEDKLIALAQASASAGTPVSQEDLDAITAAQTAIDGVTSGLAAEDAKADAVFAPDAASSHTGA